MNRNITFHVICSLFVSILNGMDEQDSWKCELSGTVVKVSRKSMYDEDGKVDVIVVGVREQKRLNRTAYRSGGIIGDVGSVMWNEVYIMKKDCDSDSQEDRDNPCEIMEKRDHNFYAKKMTTPVICVVEPRMYNSPQYGNKIDDYCYGNDFGKVAVENAQRDLFLCCHNILQEGLKSLGDKTEKSIALPALGTQTGVGMPRKEACFTLIKAILSFIQQNPGAYKMIHLFVKKRFEFEWCKNDLITIQRDSQ